MAMHLQHTYTPENLALGRMSNLAEAHKRIKLLTNFGGKFHPNVKRSTMQLDASLNKSFSIFRE